MATLSGNITASQRNIRVTDGAAVTPSLRLRVDDELIDFIRFEPYPYINGVRQKGLDPTRWVVTRGVGDSVPASHLAGATLTAAIAAAVSSETLTPPDPFADGVGGGGVTVDNQSDPPAEVTTLIAPGADLSTPGTADMSSLEGVQTVRRLGPFPVAFNTAGIKTFPGVTLATLAPGTMVLHAGWTIGTAFEQSDAVTNKVYYGLTDPNDDEDWLLTVENTPDNMDAAFEDELVQTLVFPFFNTDPGLTPAPLLLKDGALLICHMQANVTAGAGNIHLVIAEPAS